MTPWNFLHPRVSEEDLGWLPLMLQESDPRPAREQFNERYAHGGGWRPFSGFTFTEGEPPTIAYPGDPALSAIASTSLRNERIFLFPHAWVAIVQPSGEHEICSMD